MSWLRDSSIVMYASYIHECACIAKLTYVIFSKERVTTASPSSITFLTIVQTVHQLGYLGYAKWVRPVRTYVPVMCNEAYSITHTCTFSLLTVQCKEVELFISIHLIVRLYYVHVCWTVEPCYKESLFNRTLDRSPRSQYDSWKSKSR